MNGFDAFRSDIYMMAGQRWSTMCELQSTKVLHVLKQHVTNSHLFVTLAWSYIVSFLIFFVLFYCTFITLFSGCASMFYAYRCPQILILVHLVFIHVGKETYFSTDFFPLKVVYVFAYCDAIKFFYVST